MNLDHRQVKIIASLVAFIVCAILIAQLEVDPIRMFEVESEDIREYIAIPKSRMINLERTGEAEWIKE